MKFNDIKSIIFILLFNYLSYLKLWNEFVCFILNEWSWNLTKQNIYCVCHLNLLGFTATWKMWLSILYFWKKNTRLFFQKRRRVIPWLLNLFERKYYEFALPLRISENGNPKFLLYSFELKPSQVSCLAKNIWFHNCCSFHLWPQILIRSLLTFNNCNTKRLLNIF